MNYVKSHKAKAKPMKLCLISSVLLTLICALSSVTPIVSQTQNLPQKNSDVDVVKITTTLIQVDATVLDNKGQIVTGLTADDFEIYENDKRQQITNFSFVELAPGNPTESLTLKPGKNSMPIPPMQVRLRPGEVRRTIALVVDDLSLSFYSVDKVRTTLKKFVDRQMQAGDLVAIIRTSSGAGALQQFTADKRLLYAAIKHVGWNPEGPGGLGDFQPIDPSGALDRSSQGRQATRLEQVMAANTRFEEFREDIFASGTLGAINYVVKGMRELPGRKSVAVFSQGIPLSHHDRGMIRPNARLTSNFERLIELANRSSVMIYTLDPRGVVNTLMLDAEASFEGLNSDGTTSAIHQAILDRSNDLFYSQQTLRGLAEQTGGLALINNNDLSNGLERVMNDQKGYYLIGYRPDSETFDPRKARFHKLTLKLKRPDLHVRYRSGFFGIKDEQVRPAPATPRQQILAALTSPFNSGEIDLRLTSLFADDAQTGAFMRSLVYVNGRDLKFNEETDGWQKATFDIVAMTFGDNGTIVDEVSRTETIRARSDILREIREKGFVSTITVPIKKPGAYQMRVVIRDAETSRIGSSSQFIEVPDLKKGRLTLSGILLQRLRQQTETGQKEFQSDEQRDVAARSFPVGMDVQFGYGIYNAKLDQATNFSKLTMQFKVFHEGKELFASKEKDAKLVEGADPPRLLAEGMFTLGKAIQPGDYVLQVIVRDSLAKGTDQIATQWIDFEVIP